MLSSSCYLHCSYVKPNGAENGGTLVITQKKTASHFLFLVSGGQFQVLVGVTLAARDERAPLDYSSQQSFVCGSFEGPVRFNGSQLKRN